MKGVIIDTNETNYSKLKQLFHANELILEIKKKQDIEQLLNTGSPNIIFIPLETAEEGHQLSEFKGIDLLAMLRVKYRFTGIIVTFSFLTIQQLLKLNHERFILTAPGNYHYVLPEGLEELKKQLPYLKGIESEQIQSTYRPYVSAMVSEHKIQHDFGNYAGILKFQKELKLSDNELEFSENTQLAKLRSSLLYEAINFLNQNLENPELPKTQLKKMRAKLRETSTKVLLIDDMAHLGWAETLSLFFHRKKVSENEHLEIIDSFEVAQKLFPDYGIEQKKERIEFENKEAAIKDSLISLSKKQNDIHSKQLNVDRKIIDLSDNLTTWETSLRNIDNSLMASQASFDNITNEILIGETYKTKETLKEALLQVIEHLLLKGKNNQSRTKIVDEVERIEKQLNELKIQKATLAEEKNKISALVSEKQKELNDLNKNKPDSINYDFGLILLDLNLSKNNAYEGIQLLKAIRALNRTIPIIVFTSSSRNALNVLELIKHGANAYFIKNRHSMAELTQQVLEVMPIIHLLKNIGTWKLQHYLDKIEINEKVYGKELDKEKNVFNKIVLDDDSVSEIRYILNEILFPKRQKPFELRNFAMSIGNIQELYLKTGEQNKRKSLDKSILKELRDAAAHSDKWNSIKEEHITGQNQLYQ